MTLIHWTLAGMVLAALIASAIGFTLSRIKPNNPAVQNLNARIRSWWILILAGGAALLAGRTPILLLFACLSFQALREFVKIEGFAKWLCFGVLLPAQYFLIGTAAFPFWIPLSGLLAAFATNATTYGGLILCVFCLSHVPALMTLEGGEGLMVFLVLIVQASDILQYVWGKLFGRHLLAPRLSPSKTVEGLAGGMLSASLLGAALWKLTPCPAPWQAFLLALLLTTLGVAGGLVLSAIKRHRGIKDWGALLEGHGGILDRVDSLCFSAPVFFYLMKYF